MSINIEVLDIDEDLKVTEEQKERFKIENVEQADWALRVIRKANERLGGCKSKGAICYGVRTKR